PRERHFQKAFILPYLSYLSYLQTLEYYFIQIPCKEKKRKASGSLIGEAFISASIKVICDKSCFTRVYRLILGVDWQRDQ
ncbi:unnamed protein product, partial [Prunus brigantina]